MPITLRIDPRLMMRPQPRAAMRGPNSRAQRNGPLTLVSMTVSQSASVSVSLAPRMLMPALLTRMSIGPRARSASSPSRVMSLATATSAARPTTLRPVDAASVRGGGRSALGGAAGDGDVGACLGERLGHHAAEAARAAGDERAPVGQIEIDRGPTWLQLQRATRRSRPIAGRSRLRRRPAPRG